MGYLSKLRTPERVELSGGYWAEIRALMADDDDAARDAAVGGPAAIAAAQKAGSPDQLTFDGRVYNRELLTRCITSWNLDDDDGAVLPVTTEVVAQLADTDRDTLVQAVTARTRPPEGKGGNLNSV